MNGSFTFGAISSADYGVWLSGAGTYAGAEADYSAIEVPGRDGVLLLDNQRRKQMEHVYPGFIKDDPETNLPAFRAALLSQKGMLRLQDTFHPEEFYKAYYAEKFNPEIKGLVAAGTFDITFMRDPRRFLVAGETAQTITGSGTIENPTRYEAKPLIRAYGAGSFTIGSVTVNISSADEYTDIDCEIMEAYKGTMSRNLFVTSTDNEFPTLEPGTNNITMSGITRVEITPRWWTL